MPRLAFEGLEPCDGKLSCPIFMGLGLATAPGYLVFPKIEAGASIKSHKH